MAKNKKSKRKKHCSSRAEVLQMVVAEAEKKHPEKRANRFQQQLKTINQLRPVMERVKQRNREQENVKDEM